MSASGQMQLIGDKALERVLRSLPEKVQRKVTRRAVTKAATPIVKAARTKAPRDSGALAKAINKKIKTYTGTQTVVAIIGPDTKTQVQYKGKTRRPAYYAHLAHDGHITATGEHVPGNPFLRNAAEEQKPAALQTLKTEMGAGIIKEAQS